MKHRGIVMSRKGMVASAHSLISATGVDILKKGGNAVDAAVAMANTSGVVLPDMCGLGGDAFALVYDAKKKKIYAINGSGNSPQKASIEYFKELNLEKIPNDGILSVTLPGQIDTLFLLLEKFGTMKFSELCKDAIDLADNGCPISEKVARHLRIERDKIKRFDNLFKRFSKDGELLKQGELYTNHEYSKCLQLIGKNGKDEFYKGSIAKKIVEYSSEKKGLLTMDDFEKVRAEVIDPIKVNYRNYVVYQTPPVSQGIIHLEEMNILSQFDIEKYGINSPEAIHLMIEAKKIAFNDRVKYFGDPQFVVNPIKRLLSEDYAKEVSKKIKMDKSLPIIQDLIGYNENGHTTSFVVVDSEGNAVSFIHSISATWGSGEEVPGTGILLNNRAAGFNLIQGHPNCLMPNKKTMHTLNTYLVTDESNNLKWVGNTPGGDNQPQWNMQTLCNIIDFKMDVQSALETPKWVDIQSSNPDGKTKNQLKIESQIGKEKLAKLESMGHELHIIEPFSCSGASQLIEVTENGVLFGASDPRCDGCAMPEV